MMMPAAGFQMPAMPMMSGGSGSGIKLTFKNAKITIDRMIISEKKEKK
jgi:acetyl-CoA decarbonylase/synthase complex subunit beta